MKTLFLAAAVAAAVGIPSLEHPIVRGDNDWKVDPVHSSVVFKVKHVGTSWFYGTFDSINGSFSLDPAHAADGSVEIHIDAGSIATRDQKRDEHLRGPDFLDAKQFPTIDFKSTKIQKDGDAFAVAGNLTLRGETKPVTLHVQKTGEGDFFGKRIGYETSFTIKRSDFGITGGQADKGLSDEIMLMIAVEGVQGGK